MSTETASFPQGSARKMVLAMILLGLGRALVFVVWILPQLIASAGSFAAWKLLPGFRKRRLRYSAAARIPRDDPRWELADFGERMLKRAELGRKTAWLTALAWAGIWFGASAVTGVGWLMILAMFAYAIYSFGRSVKPRIPTDVDFRKPILVLRSYSERELVDFFWFDDDTGHGGWDSQLTAISADLWDWPRVLIFLGEESLNASHVNAIELRPSDPDWEDAFEQTLESTWFVVVFPAATKCCRRELRLLPVYEALPKTIVVMPPGHEAAERWEKTREALRNMGVNLPPHDPKGMFYLPNEDYSIRQSVSLDGAKYLDWTKLKRLAPAFDILDLPLAQCLPHPFFEHGREDMGEGGNRVGVEVASI
jgi:hypothetical protein